MRSRHVIGAALGALALIVTMPTPANALNGHFKYQYGNVNDPTWGQLENPTGGDCHQLPGVEGTNQDAYAPWNLIKAKVHLFSEEWCEGTYTTIGPAAQHGAEVKFRSVMFEG